MGVDDCLEGSEWFLEDTTRLGHKVLQSGYVPALRQLCKRGLPTELRARVWAAALGVGLGSGSLHSNSTAPLIPPTAAAGGDAQAVPRVHPASSGNGKQPVLSGAEEAEVAALLQHVETWDLITDELYRMDLDVTLPASLCAMLWPYIMRWLSTSI